MSGRGGRRRVSGSGGCGRGHDPGRGQPSRSFPRGSGGGGRGSGTDSGRGCESSGHPASNTMPPPQTAPARPPPQAVPAHQPSSSAGAGPLSQEFSQNLTLGYVAATTMSPLPVSSTKAVRFRQRPGYGTDGTKCTVRANHFLVNVATKELDVHHYDITISPEVTSKKVNRDIMRELCKKYKQSDLGNRLVAYDGMKSFYTATALPFEFDEFVVKLLDTGPGPSSSTTVRTDQEFKVVVKLVSKPDIHFLMKFLSGGHSECPQETIQALNVVLRASLSEKYNVVGKSFFCPPSGSRGVLGNGIEYWTGYYQSLRPTQMGLSLNIDVSARSFYEPILVTNFVWKLIRPQDKSRPLSDQDRIKVEKTLKGVKVQLTYLNYPRTSKIVGISREPTSRLMFALNDTSTNVSVAQYFDDKYSIVLDYPSLPAIQSGSEARPVYLPMELCRIVEGQRYMKKLDNQQVRQLLRKTCQHPNVRERNVKMMVEDNNFEANELVRKEFGIQVHKDLALIDARVLPPPTLKYHGDNGCEQSIRPGFGSWNMNNKKMFNGGKVDSWTCVNFSSYSEDIIKRFCKKLVDMCNRKGMDFCNTPTIEMRSACTDKIHQTLSDIHKDCADKNKPLELLIVILPDQTGSYGKIKRICETELGIVSQCCKPGDFSKFGEQYFENLALKINVKVGGRNTVLNDDIQKMIPHATGRSTTTIIFGADVSHPQPGEDSSSIAAVVASMDWPEITTYRGVFSAQTHRVEIIQDLYKAPDPQKGTGPGGMIRELLFAFKKSTKLKPERIIFYRDGVGESQFSRVLLHEMDAIQKACASIEKGYMPLVTFVVVQKRHHTRLFPTDHDDRNKTVRLRNGNVLPGTVVDKQICHPTEFDFYLNSHAAIEGTSKPTHYHVLFDGNGFSADNLQKLTNNLCYTYARCTKSVSIVPPAYYAHLVALRARYYVEDSGVDVRNLPDIRDNVKEVMFYC